MPLEKQACGRFFMEKDAEKPLPEEEERVYKKKKGIYPRHPIFINLKSNTMKNTVQRYGLYVIQHNN